MIKTAIIVYLVVAIFTFLALMIAFAYAWNKNDDEIDAYEAEYPEGAGNAILAACFFFVISFLAAVLWPTLPLILVGIWIVEKISEIFTDNWNPEDEEEKEEKK